MKALYYIVFLILVSTALQAQQEQLIWADEFNGNGVPDPMNWSYDIGNTGWGNNEIQNYTSQTWNVRQDSGLLIIEARKSGTIWTSGRIITHNKFNFTHGRIVFRAKLPSGSGTWPALWMLGESFTTIGWPACGEVDVMEHVGKNPGYVHSALHTTSSSGNTVNTSSLFVTNVFSQFHEYQANWTAEKIEFSVDGNLFYTYNPPVKNAATWPFDNPFFLIMNIAMGGNWGSDPQYETNGLKNGIDPTLTLARMEIDYVRVYVPTASVEEFPPTDENEAWKNVLFSPNPSNGQFQLKVPAGKPVKGIIYNLTGIDVFHFQTQNDTNTIDISFLPKGLYYMSLTLAGETRTKKLILE